MDSKQNPFNAVNSFGHSRDDLLVQHEIDIFPDRIRIANSGSFANGLDWFRNPRIHSFLRNETIARVLYLCEDIETFGSGIRKICSLCNTAEVEIKFENDDTNSKIEFSGIDRNKSPFSGRENGWINDYINELEYAELRCSRDNSGMTNVE